MTTSFDLYQLILDVYVMVTSFANKMYDILSMRFTIPYVIWQPLHAIMRITSPLIELPQSFTVLTLLGGSFLALIIVASVIKAVNFLT